MQALNKVIIVVVELFDCHMQCSLLHVLHGYACLLDNGYFENLTEFLTIFWFCTSFFLIFFPTCLTPHYQIFRFSFMPCII